MTTAAKEDGVNLYFSSTDALKKDLNPISLLRIRSCLLSLNMMIIALLGIKMTS